MKVRIALLALLLAGCGGGGGGDSAEALPPAGPPAMGASPDQSAVQAMAALGSPAAVSGAEADETLTRLDTFGLPHDLFDAKIEPAVAPVDPALTAPTVPVVPVVPVVPTVPTVPTDAAVPTTPVGGATTTTAETPAAPADSALTKEDREVVASLSISGEAILARVGDAVPPDSQEIVIASIEADRVVLRLVRGLLPDGGDRVTLVVGQSMTLTDGMLGRTYTVKLLEVRAAE